jgi:hypothetical protein
MNVDIMSNMSQPEMHTIAHPIRLNGHPMFGNYFNDEIAMRATDKQICRRLELAKAITKKQLEAKPEEAKELMASLRCDYRVIMSQGCEYLYEIEIGRKNQRATT